MCCVCYVGGGFSSWCQVRNAQRAGATAVLILDIPQGTGSNGDTLPPASPTSVMQDDGTGTDVAIPSLLLTPEQSRRLLRTLRLRPACLARGAAPRSACGLLRHGLLLCPHNASAWAPPLPPRLQFQPEVLAAIAAIRRVEDAAGEGKGEGGGSGGGGGVPGSLVHEGAARTAQAWEDVPREESSKVWDTLMGMMHAGRQAPEQADTTTPP